MGDRTITSENLRLRMSTPPPLEHFPGVEPREQLTPVSFSGSSTQFRSLGTPVMFGRRRPPPSSTSSRYRTLRSTPRSCFSNDPPIDTNNIVLVATRPLLKSLARHCRPFPPWCVGKHVPEGLTEEMGLFTAFLGGTAAEYGHYESELATVGGVFKEIWPNVELCAMSTMAVGLPPLKDMTLHFFAKNTPMPPESQRNTQLRLLNLANDAGLQAEFCYDYRDMTCLLLTDACSGVRMNIRYGSAAAQVEVASTMFASVLATSVAGRQTFTVLDALLRQNKILDDTGTNADALNSEALATMLVAVLNSYEPNDMPDSGRLLTDFFLTYGFSANFDMLSNSISARGLLNPVVKVHRNAQISVLDPSNESLNLTSRLQKMAHLQAVFNYCYTAISQFTQVDGRHMRAQSTLSTIIGGESYWSRVLQLYHEGISPYYEIVNERKAYLARML